MQFELTIGIHIQRTNTKGTWTTLTKHLAIRQQPGSAEAIAPGARWIAPAWKQQTSLEPSPLWNLWAWSPTELLIKLIIWCRAKGSEVQSFDQTLNWDPICYSASWGWNAKDPKELCPGNFNQQQKQTKRSSAGLLTRDVPDDHASQYSRSFTVRGTRQYFQELELLKFFMYAFVSSALIFKVAQYYRQFSHSLIEAPTVLLRHSAGGKVSSYIPKMYGWIKWPQINYSLCLGG